MARRFRVFRLWEKKRGSRRTTSHLLGGVGEALFFAALLLIGTIALAVLVTNQFLTAAADGATVSAWRMSLSVLVVTALIVIGGGGVVLSVAHVRASVERRSAIAKLADLDLLRGARPAAQDFPTVPSDTDLTNSPGVRLAYRLPQARSPMWKFATVAALWLVSLGVASVLAAWAINSFRTSRPEVYPAAVGALFVLIGLAMTGWFVRLLLRQISVGPTSVEISDHPLQPGQSYRVCVLQAGQARMNWLQLKLVCLEEATYQQGTNLRTESQPVCSQRVFRHEQFRIDPGRPFEHECQLYVPEEAMHSFTSPGNAIHWKLVVSGSAAGWPEFERSFPIVVYPCTSRPVTTALSSRSSA